MSDWTLFSNHGHVLVCLARDNKARLRSVARDIGITERAVQKIVRELQQEGFITVSKHGRCNRYEINTRKYMRHTLESKCTVGRLLQLFRKDVKRGDSVDDVKSGRVETEESMETTKITPVPTLHEVKQDDGQKVSTSKQEEVKKTKQVADSREQGSLF